jgi:hypothetical protein
MKFLLLLVYLISTHAHGASIWPNGTRLETFQNGFLFGNGETIDSSPTGFLFDNAAQFNGPFVLQQSATPSSPLTGFNKLYFKSDDNLYKLDSLGNESAIGSIEVGGQEQTPLASLSVAVPNNQATQLAAGETLLETGNKNLLANPGFEHSTYSTGWTITGAATVSGTTSSSEVLSGKKSFKAVMTGNAVQLTQDTTLYVATLGNVQLFLRMVYTNTAPGAKMCVRKNGVTLSGSNDCVFLATDGVRRTVELAFLGDSTSNGFDVDTGTTAGTLTVDDVELSTESSAFIDVAQIGPWLTYPSTPIFNGLGTPTAVEAFYRVNGSNLDLRVKFISGSSTAAEMRVGLPAGYISSNASVIPTIQRVGSAASGLTLGSEVTVLIEPSVSYVTFGGTATAGATPLTKRNGDALIGTGNFFSFFASIPVQGLSNKITTYSQQCVNDRQCENTFTFYYNGTTVVDQFGNNYTVTKSGTNNNLKDINITPLGLTQTMRCSSASSDAAGSFIVGFINATASSLVVSTTTPSVFVDLGFTITCTKQGVDYKAKNVITGSFQNIEKCADPYECTNVYSAKIDGTLSPSIVSSENIDWINGNCTRPATGIFDCPVNSGLFSVLPNCTATSNSNASGGTTVFDTTVSTTTNLRFIMANDGVALVNNKFNIICQKQGADFKPKTAVAGTYLDAVTSPGAGRPVIRSARISNTGVVSNEVGEWITGNCTMSSIVNTCTITGFASAPNCVFTHEAEDLGTNMAKAGVSTSSQLRYVTQLSSANTYSALTVNVMCMGIAP